MGCGGVGATIGGAAVIGGGEGEAGIGGPGGGAVVGIGIGGEHQTACPMGNVGGHNGQRGADRNRPGAGIKGEGAVGRQGRNGDRGQIVPLHRIGKAEVGSSKGMAGILDQGDRVISGNRGIIDRGDNQRHLAIIAHRAIAHRIGERGGGAVIIGERGEGDRRQFRHGQRAAGGIDRRCSTGATQQVGQNPFGGSGNAGHRCGQRIAIHIKRGGQAKGGRRRILINRQSIAVFGNRGIIGRNNGNVDRAGGHSPVTVGHRVHKRGHRTGIIGHRREGQRCKLGRGQRKTIGHWRYSPRTTQLIGQGSLTARSRNRGHRQGKGCIIILNIRGKRHRNRSRHSILIHIHIVRRSNRAVIIGSNRHRDGGGFGHAA